MKREVLTVWRDGLRITVGIRGTIDAGTAMASLEALVPVLLGVSAPGTVNKAAELGFIGVQTDDGHMLVVANAALYDNPATWGIVIADLAGHIANAYVSRGFDPVRVLAEVKQVTRDEWDRPTDKPRSVGSIDVSTAQEYVEDELKRYKLHLDDIRCDLLDSGLVTLTDADNDSDPELTPRRLVQALLKQVPAHRPACPVCGDQDQSDPRCDADGTCWGCRGTEP